jgi:beta-mannosidase
MDLSGRWHALEADDDLRRTWLDDGDDEGWEPIDVPGHWRSSPAFADSDGPVLHRRHFTCERPDATAGERAWLVLDGCFYQTDVWLDGAYVGDTEGYFFPHAFDVTDALADRTEHLLGVEATCGRPGDLTAKRNLTGVFQHWDRLDPDWNPGGIWRPVRIERSGPVRIRHLRVLCRAATAEQATVGVRAVLDAADPGPVTVRTTVAGVDTEEVHTLAAGENQLTWTVTVPEPDLWWPHSLGDQPLHDVAIEVSVPTDEEHTTSDRRVRRIGFRQVALRDWVASINGERLFLKGSDLGPTRMSLADATPEEVARDVALAVETGLDLLRVHAHVSRPELYDAADEAGLLLWQDMPLQWGYARTVRKQAVRQAREAVDLLGHHPSVAIWCGHDEPIALDVEPGREAVPASTLRRVAGQQLPGWNRTVLDRSIKRALTRNDGTRPVIPHSGVVPHPPQLDGTDTHLSLGWATGEVGDLPALARVLPRMVRFVTGLGAQAVPDTDDFVDPAGWPDLDWDGLARHHGLQRSAMERHVPPDAHPTYEGWRAATQRYQAGLVRRQVEELRRLKYRPTGGFVHVGFADGHPGITTSVLDHARVPKPAWHALAAACRPVIVVADRLPAAVLPGDPLALDVHVVNDRREPIEDLVAAVDVHWSGDGHAWRFQGSVEADSVTRVGTVQLVVPDAPGPLDLRLALRDGSGRHLADNDDATVVLEG